MALIGSLGGVSFSVSRRTVRTIDALKYDSSARYTTHQRHLKKPLLEFGGASPESVSFTMTVSSFLGCSPRKEAEQLRKYLNNGTLLTFVLGNRLIGDYRWVITKLSQGDFRIGKGGEILAVKCSVTLNSYEKR